MLRSLRNTLQWRSQTWFSAGWALVCDTSFLDTILLSSCGIELTCCCFARSTWGRNRVQEHTDTERALRLILPVKTDPAIVQQAVAGLNSGSIGLHMGNVEPILVLANAIGVSLLSSIRVAGIYCCTLQHTMLPSGI